MRKDDFMTFRVVPAADLDSNNLTAQHYLVGTRMGQPEQTLAACEDKDIAHDIRNALEPKKRSTYMLLATLVQTRLNCQREPKNPEWEQKHGERIKQILRTDFPHGSGFDHGCHLDFDKSTGERLVIVTSFHHMDENGMYDGWTEHTIIVTPSLQFGFQLRITGRDRNQIKEMMYEMFS